MAEISDEELERRMRAKLFADKGAHSTRTLSEEEQRIARGLLGTANAERIANAKEGRRVRLAPVRITYEWYWFKTEVRYFGESWGWRINRLENGRRFMHREGGSEDDLEAEIAALKGKGFSIVESQIDNSRQSRKEPKVSARKAILEELRFIRR